MATLDKGSVREGLDDYADDCDEDAIKQARIDAENVEIMESIMECEIQLELQLSEKNEEELLDMILNPNVSDHCRFIYSQELYRRLRVLHEA